MSKRMVQFSIYRYDPDKDDAPYMQDISVELEPTDRKLLDALTKLKAKDEATVAIKEIPPTTTTMKARSVKSAPIVCVTPPRMNSAKRERPYAPMTTRSEPRSVTRERRRLPTSMSSARPERWAP